MCNFILGLLIGGMIGIMVIALLSANGEDDKNDKAE